MKVNLIKFFFLFTFAFSHALFAFFSYEKKLSQKRDYQGRKIMNYDSFIFKQWPSGLFQAVLETYKNIC